MRTLFRMPDLFSFELGGGSHVSLDPIAVGPLSVGDRLTSDAIAFGGGQLTASDIGIAAGLLDIGNRAKVAHLDAATCRAVLRHVQRMLGESVDRVKTEAGDVKLLAVGGGAFLLPGKLEGVSEVVRVPHGDCANAVGAAIVQVSGEVDQVFRDLSREAAIAAAEELAANRAVAAGAERGTLTVIETEDIPIAYLPGNARRIRVGFNSSYMAEVVRAGIQTVPKGLIEAARSSGLNHVQAMTRIVLPIAFKNMLPAIVSRFIALFMGTSLAYIIGATEFFRAANDINNRVFRPYEIYTFVALVYFVFCYALSLLGRLLEHRLSRGQQPISSERMTSG